MTIAEREKDFVEKLRAAREQAENLNITIERLTGAIIVLREIMQEEAARQPTGNAQGVSVA